MNDDLDSMNDLDSILAEFGGSAPQEEAPAAPAAKTTGSEVDLDIMVDE